MKVIITGTAKLFHALLSPLYPLIKRLSPRYITSTVQTGQTMITAAKHEYSSQSLENK